MILNAIINSNALAPVGVKVVMKDFFGTWEFHLMIVMNSIKEHFQQQKINVKQLTSIDYDDVFDAIYQTLANKCKRKSD